MGRLTDLRRDIGALAREATNWRYGLATYAIVTAIGILVLIAAAAFAAVLEIPGSVLTREPQVTLGGAFYTGALSNLGALVWMVGVVMAAVGWWSTLHAPLKQAFLAGATVGAVLLIDDFFLVHDWVRTQSLVLDRVLLAVYMLLVVGLVARYWRPLGAVASVGILGSFALLSLSAVLDFFFNALDQLIEDGFKLVGIGIWAASWSVLTLDRLGRRIDRTNLERAG